MIDAGDATQPPALAGPPAAIDASPFARPIASDDRASRRDALRELAASIGVEVFY